jgi:hypothetical protein
MKVKILLSITTAILLQAAAAQAQFGLGKPKEIAVVKSQPLIVILKEEDPKQLKKLASKPEELADYKAGIADYNAQMRELAPKLWKLSSGVEFKPESELETLRKAKKTQRPVLRHLSFALGHRHRLGGKPMGSLNVNDYYYTTEQVSALVIDLLGEGDENHVGRIQIAAGPVYPSDMIFSLKYLQTYLQARADGRSSGDMREEIAQNGKRIPTKTLLIDEGDVKNKLTAADIKQVYPYPYQIVPRTTIEQAVADGDAHYAYIRLLPATETITVQVVVDAANADLLGMSIPSRVQMMGISNGSSIGKGNFKDFAKSAGK